jgi:hypothetical protein
MRKLLQMHKTIVDTIFATTHEDDPIRCTIEVKEEEPWLIEDPLTEATSSFTTTTRMDDVKVLSLYTQHMHTRTNKLSPSPLTSVARYHHTSYDRSPFNQSCMPFTVCGVLKDLNIVGNDTKLNNDTMQDYTCRIMDFFLPPCWPFSSH